jgi:hypothetical protein
MPRLFHIQISTTHFGEKMLCSEENVWMDNDLSSSLTNNGLLAFVYTVIVTRHAAFWGVVASGERREHSSKSNLF